MQRVRLGLLSLLLPVLFLWTTTSTNAAPLAAIALLEGRTYDQAHDTGYIDWNGSVHYVYLNHRETSALPPEEGGAVCSSGCWEWVTRLGNGGQASGSFDRRVSYFEAMVAFTPDSSVGNAVLRACSAVQTWDLQTGTGLPGFVSMELTVPSGCRSWSLTASGGYVDFRSVDVTYVGPPSTATPTPTSTVTGTPTATFTPTLTSTPTRTFTPTFTPTNTATSTFTFTPTATFTSTLTNTPTQTFTPTFTPTNTATSTFTFTPTATNTHTPSPTPTPLPPQIIGLVVCDRWGDAGWCRGKESLELNASDQQGFDVTITGDLNGVPFTCGSICSLPLPEGIGIANYQVTSTSGRTASDSSKWQRDAAPPELEVILPPMDGENGWYVSQVTLSATAKDAISGLSSLNGSTDEGATWISFPIQFMDGNHRVLIHARDVAGNEVVASKVIRVDTIPPVTQITSHSNGEVVQGDVPVAGSLEDQMSGPASGEISLDHGVTWQAVSIGTGSTWSYLWHSNEVPNGEYTLQMRGMDRAGNVGDVVSVTLTVDNGPPAVSISERWWIWESGQLKVSPNHFPIASIQVTIRDPQNRWSDVVMGLNPNKVSFPISWDRRFADGTLAPSGEYLVLAVACDVNGLCGRDTGRIVIPVMATSTATLPPSPTVTSTLTPSTTPISTQIPPSATPFWATPIPEKTSEPSRSSFPLWQIIGLLGLFLVVASASVVDPRPKALDRLGEIFRVMSAQAKDTSFDINKIRKTEKDI